jgi:hypothetical protein
MIKHQLNHLAILRLQGIRLEVDEVRNPVVVVEELRRKDRQPALVEEMTCQGRGKQIAVEDNLGTAELAAALVEDKGKDTDAEGNPGMVEEAFDHSRDSSFQRWQRGCKDPMALVHLDTGEEDAHGSSRWRFDEDVEEQAEDVSSPFRKSWALRRHEATFSPGLARPSS